MTKKQTILTGHFVDRQIFFISISSVSLSFCHYALILSVSTNASNFTIALTILIRKEKKSKQISVLKLLRRVNLTSANLISPWPQTILKKPTLLAKASGKYKIESVRKDASNSNNKMKTKKFTCKSEIERAACGTVWDRPVRLFPDLLLNITECVGPSYFFFRSVGPSVSPSKDAIASRGRQRRRSLARLSVL